MKKLIIILIVTFSLQSCYNDNEEDIYGPVLCDTSEVTFSADVNPIINSSCATTNCHASGGSGPGDFTQFDELKAKVDDGSFVNRVIEQQTMPPGTPLTDCELQTLQAWLDAGATNN